MRSELAKAEQLRKNLVDGELVVGGQVTFTDPGVVEILGRAGYDFLAIDVEHSAHTLDTVRGLLVAGIGTDAVILVRPLRLDADEIRRYLDVGAAGILCPFIESEDDAAALVTACRYPPRGKRSYGPRRAAAYGYEADGYLDGSDAAVICIPIIESVRAVENIEGILSVDGIDAVSIGPADLSMSLGIFGEYEHADYIEALDRVREACADAGKVFGQGCYSLEYAEACRAKGDTFLMIGGDDLGLRLGAELSLAVKHRSGEGAT